MPDEPVAQSGSQVQPDPVIVQRLFELGDPAFGHCLRTVAVLGIADLLASGPKHIEELATATDTHADSLYRMLRALAADDVFSEVAPRQFALTPLAEPLRSDVEFSARASIASGSEWAVWAEILYSVRTGKPALEKVHGRSWIDLLRGSPASITAFNRAMRVRSYAIAGTISDAYDFSGASLVVDIGGGTGSTLAAILQSHPAVTGVLFDLPEVLEHAPAVLQAAGVQDRCRMIAGDFFSGVPEGADCYVLSSVLHDWGDSSAGQILTRLRQAMPPHGRVLIVEAVVPEGGGRHWSKWRDITMLVLTGGRERTLREYQALLTASDLRLTGVSPTRSVASLIEAARPVDSV